MNLRASRSAESLADQRQIFGVPLVDARARGYRPDVDGLRALAVSIVLIFHTGISPLRGGFVGVDIFFVISGFLITSLLVRDLETGRFSIKTFYERRIRRIFPAMMVMLAVVLAASPLFLFQSELRVTASTGVASLLSAANLYLMTAAGYFEADALTQPLLHMWSLGVEEQFYLFFPLLLAFAVRRFPNRVAAFLLFLTLASLALSVVVTSSNRDVAYFFPLTRAWELLIGALIVVIPLPQLTRGLREIGAALALALILYCAYKLHSGMPFPGWIAALPTLAAAALIVLGSMGGSLINRGFSLPPVVFLGQISYSLYLWHWPIIVGYRLTRGGHLVFWEAVMLIAASLAAAILSWRFVERPFREKHLLPGQSALFVGAAGITALLAIACGWLFMISALSPNPKNEADRLARYITYDDRGVYRRGQCFLVGHLNNLSDFDETACLKPSPEQENVLVVGDSHGAHLWSGLQAALPQAHVLQATSTGCKPVVFAKGEATCRALIQHVFDQIGSGFRPDVLILSARWEDTDLPALLETISVLRPKVARLVVSGPIVEYGVALPRLLAQIADGRDPTLLFLARKTAIARVDQQFAEAVQQAGADYFSPFRSLCSPDGEVCRTTDDNGVPLQWDYGHLTKEGSVLIGRVMQSSGLLERVVD